MLGRGERWWLTGTLVGLLGLFLLSVGAAGLACGPRDPDHVGGLVFGGVLLSAGAVILAGRRPRA
jgi:hypothetical protein